MALSPFLVNPLCRKEWNADPFQVRRLYIRNKVCYDTEHPGDMYGMMKRSWRGAGRPDVQE